MAFSGHEMPGTSSRGEVWESLTKLTKLAKRLPLTEKMKRKKGSKPCQHEAGSRTGNYMRFLGVITDSLLKASS